MRNRTRVKTFSRSVGLWTYEPGKGRRRIQCPSFDPPPRRDIEEVIDLLEANSLPRAPLRRS
ncbi:MAG: hypothetical protein U9R75_01510 [Candidatus Thermoplasmatota archaeon]|nr:hypothetical protein [Candidatus Thermoplasmatota archaeon]